MRRFVSRSTVLLGTVTVAFGVALAVAAYQGSAARDEFTQRTLRDYAQYYAANATNYVSWEMHRTLRARLLVRIQRLELRRGASPEVEEWARSHELVEACRCVPGLDEVVTIRTNAPGDSLGMRGRLADDSMVSNWLARAVRAWSDTISTDEAWVELFGDEKVQHLALSAYARRDRSGETVSVFGYVADLRTALSVATLDIMERVPLFPSKLSDPSVNPTLVRLVLRSRAGDTLFASPPVESAAQPIVVQRPELGGVDAIVLPTRRTLDLMQASLGPVTWVPMLAGGFIVALALLSIQLWALRQHESTVHARAAFVATISHELRTPLTQILLFAERARDALGESPGERREALDVVIREAERLAHLADNAIHVTIGARTAIPLRKQSADLPTLVEEVLERYAPTTHHAGITIDFTASNDLTVAVDPSAISQIVLNLLDNAVRHAMGTKVVRVLVERHGKEAHLVVEDEGPGVPPSRQEAIWEPFTGFDTGRATMGGTDGSSLVRGSGIGLSVVRNLANAHGGRAWVEAASDGGARFVVAFPL